MAENSWPFHDAEDGGTPVVEDQWSIMARQWAVSGVIGVPGDMNLRVYANSSGREVHVSVGRASVRGHWYELDAATTLAISANTSGYTRIDRVVLVLDPAADEIVLDVKEGTPSGTPSAPTLTQTDLGTYELSLAQVTVANNASTLSEGTVADDRLFSNVSSTVCTSSKRPPSPTAGWRIYEIDTGRSMVWNGTAWVDDPDQTARTAAAAAQASANAALPKSGGTMSGAIAMGSQKITGLAAGSAAGDAIRFEQLPVGGQASGTTDASGYMDITHGMGTTPTWAVVTIESSGSPRADFAIVNSRSSTVIQIRVYRDGGTPLATGAVKANWFAR